jgi:hypothetical protein
MKQRPRHIPVVAGLFLAEMGNSDGTSVRHRLVCNRGQVFRVWAAGSFEVGRPMPRYYFDNRDGEKLVPNDTGVVLPSIEQARDQAAQALAELAKDVLAGSIHRELATEIRNEAGEPLLRATLVFEVERLRWLLSAGSAARRHR